MLLLCIYGPAASGKLTVARELGARTGVPVFHNHLVVDMLTPVFGFGSAPFIELRELVWLKVLARAAEELIPGVIFTFTPERTVHHGFIARLTETMQGTGAEIIFIQLTCPEQELERRMEDPSRSRYGKVHSVVQYRSLRDSGAFDYLSIPNTRLTIDTSITQPPEAAETIIKRFALPTES